MIKSNVVFIVICGLLLIGCGKKEGNREGLTYRSTEQEFYEAQTANFKKVLDRQLVEGRDSYRGSFDNYDKKDFDALLEYEQAILVGERYKTPTNKVFMKRVYEVFGRMIDTLSSSEYIRINKRDPCDKSSDLVPLRVSDNYLYVSKKLNIITDFYALPEVVDYKKMMSHRPNIENTYKGKKGGAWRDHDDLFSIREANNANLVNRNKYLFSNSSDARIKLSIADKGFLMDLVRYYGYVKDKELLRWVIDNSGGEEYYGHIDDMEEFAKMFYQIDCEGKFKVHQETMDMIISHNGERNILGIKEVIWESLRREDLFSELTFAQKAHLYAYLFETCRRIDKKEAYAMLEYTDLDVTNAFNSVKDEYDDEFVRNNFYGYKELKDWWKLAMVQDEKFTERM